MDEIGPLKGPRGPFKGPRRFNRRPAFGRRLVSVGRDVRPFVCTEARLLWYFFFACLSSVPGVLLFAPPLTMWGFPSLPRHTMTLPETVHQGPRDPLKEPRPKKSKKTLSKV